MNKQEQYESIEWIKKSEEIRKRDNFACVRCGAVETDKLKSDVHHICYRVGKKVWEYDNSEFKTLCIYCHKYETEFIPIPMYNVDGKFIGNMYECFQCNGTGYIEEHSYYMGGICHKCRGIGFDRKVPLRAFLNPELIKKHKEFYENRKGK